MTQLQAYYTMDNRHCGGTIGSQSGTGLAHNAFAATPCEISIEHRRGLYVVWLRKSAGKEPVRHEL